MNDNEFSQVEIEEILRDKQVQMHDDMMMERRLRADFDYALEHLGLCPEMSIGDFSKAYNTLKEYDWDIDVWDLMQYTLMNKDTL